MFTRSHLQELKRRYASIYAPPVDIEGVNQYKKDTPGQEEEIEEHCGVCGEQGIEEVEVAESFELQATMALDDAGVKSKWKKGKLYVAKRDIKKAEKALGKSFKRMKKGAEPDLYYEEVELDEEVADIAIRKDVGKMGKNQVAAKVMTNARKLFGLKASVNGEYVRISGSKKKVNDYLAVIIGRSSTGDATQRGPSNPQIDRMLTKGLKEEVELAEKGTAYPATVDTLRKIVKDKQHQTVMFKSGKALVDLFTASAIIAVYDGMKKPELKKKLEDMIKSKE